jgi:hypothetical protein
VDQSVSLGASAKFQVAGTSTNPPIRYQWRFGATNLEGQTNSALLLTMFKASTQAIMTQS